MLLLKLLLRTSMNVVVTEKQQQMLLCRALEDILHSIVRTESYLLVSHHADTYNGGDDGNDVDLDDESGSGTSSPKKQCFSHDQFHLGLRCVTLIFC